MNNMYELEVVSFEKNFSLYRDKKIVLYGIGRKTATIISYLNGFNIIGLMDRDSSNIGKIMFGVPVISLSEAEEKADLIIINAPEMYWNIIYKRIADSKIDVFFVNGEKASLIEEYSDNDIFGDDTLQGLEEKLLKYDIVSFDIFDTLIMRRVLQASDVFKMVSYCLKKRHVELNGADFETLRNEAIIQMNNPYYTYDELYKKMQDISGVSDECIAKIKKIEFEIEKSIIIPRQSMVDLCNRIKKVGKKIYIISDMYFSKEVLYELLVGKGLDIERENILVSCELKKDKSSGTLWRDYKDSIVQNKRAIHIGDNKIADIENAMKYGIDAYHVMGAVEMLKVSSVKEVYDKVTDLHEALVVGVIISRMFNNPFVLNQTKGRVVFSEKEEWGYCLWGNIIFSFCEWLLNQSIRREIKQLYFLSRDGYLIKEDFDYYVSTQDCKNNYPRSNYLYTSRGLAFVAAIKNETDFRQWVCFPYNGEFADYLQDRFLVTIADSDMHKNEMVQLPDDRDKVLDWLIPYLGEIKLHIMEEQKNYVMYLNNQCFDEKSAVIDVGYHGSVQYKLSSILGKELIGFYFYSYLNADNEYCKKTEMIPCFQDEDDKVAGNSAMRKSTQLVESMFTAPYGMVLAVDKDGEPICARNCTNQYFFMDRIKINNGIKLFIKDMQALNQYFDGDKLCEKALFADAIYGVLLAQTDMSEDMKKIFVWEDATIQRRENSLFN